MALNASWQPSNASRMAGAATFATRLAESSVPSAVTSSAYATGLKTRRAGPIGSGRLPIPDSRERLCSGCARSLDLRVLRKLRHRRPVADPDAADRDQQDDRDWEQQCWPHRAHEGVCEDLVAELLQPENNLRRHTGRQREAGSRLTCAYLQAAFSGRAEAVDKTVAELVRQLSRVADRLVVKRHGQA